MLDTLNPLAERFRHRLPTPAEAAVIEEYAAAEGLAWNGRSGLFEVTLLTPERAQAELQLLEDEAARGAGYSSARARDAALRAAIGGALAGPPGIASCGPAEVPASDDDFDFVLATVGYERAAG